MPRGLASRLDWMLKFRILQRAMQQQPGLTWASPEIKHLDHLYGSLDPAEGLYWVYERLGAVERLVSESEIDRFVHEPPEDTRAWTRAMLLRLAGPDGVEHVDWDVIRFRRAGRGDWPVMRTLRLDDPLGFTRSLIERVIHGAPTLDDVLDALQAEPAVTDSNPSLYEWDRGRGTADESRGNGSIDDLERQKKEVR